MRKKPTPKKSLTPEQVVQMTREWNEKTQAELAKEFGVSANLICNIAKALYIQSDGAYCKPRMSRRQVIMEALKILKSEDEKEVKTNVIS